jgi:hypothetical protein
VVEVELVGPSLLLVLLLPLGAVVVDVVLVLVDDLALPELFAALCTEVVGITAFVGALSNRCITWVSCKATNNIIIAAIAIIMNSMSRRRDGLFLARRFLVLYDICLFLLYYKYFSMKW